MRDLLLEGKDVDAIAILGRDLDLIPRPADVDDVIAEVTRHLDSMSEPARQDFFQTLFERFCRHCSRKRDPEERYIDCAFCSRGVDES